MQAEFLPWKILILFEAIGQNSRLRKPFCQDLTYWIPNSIKSNRSAADWYEADRSGIVLTYTLPAPRLPISCLPLRLECLLWLIKK
jgi:hypothetical protein